MNEEGECGVKSMKYSFMIPFEVLKIPHVPDTFINCIYILHINIYSKAN